MISSSGTSSKPCSVSTPFRYLIGCPLGSWIMRKAIVPSVEMAENILTGTRTSERRRLPDQTGMGAMLDTRETLRTFPNLGQPLFAASEQTRTNQKELEWHTALRPERVAGRGVISCNK